MSGILVPIAFFAMIAAVIIVPGWLKSQERMRLHETLKASIERGQPIPAEVIEAITSDVKVKRPPSSQRDIRTAIIWLGVAVGLAAIGGAVSFDEPDAARGFFAAAAFPGFIGLAFVLMAFLSRNRKA